MCLLCFDVGAVGDVKGGMARSHFSQRVKTSVFLFAVQLPLQHVIDRGE